MPNTLTRALCLVAALVLCIPALAQGEAPEPDISARELLEVNQKAEEVAARVSADHGTLAEQSTPLTAMLGLRDALRARDYAAAGKYLDRRYIEDELGNLTDEQLVRALAYAWTRQNILDLSRISDQPEGDLKDGLPAYRDQVGSIVLSNEVIPIYLQRVPDGHGGKVWKLSNATVARIPDMWAELGYSEAAEKMSRWLPPFRFLGMENWQVLGLALSFLFAWPLAGLIAWLLMQLALRVPNQIPDSIRRFFRRPVRFFLFIVIAGALLRQLGLSLTTRILLSSSGIDYVAYSVLLLGLLTVLRDRQIHRMQAAGNAHYVALLKPFTTIVKVLMVTVIALVWAKRAGYDMSTILAGLGVGSLAVALAAQKTLENVIGAITLYTARPVSAGDFCRFGDITGTVEEIGLRSTLIRTLDRSLVVIPNAVFSSQEVENFSQRDRIRYFRRFQLALPAPEALRGILDAVRQLLEGHAKLIEGTVSVRFEDIRDANAILRLDAGVDTRDYQEFLAVAEELNLGVMGIAGRADARFAGPARLLLDEDAIA